MLPFADSLGLGTAAEPLKSIKINTQISLAVVLGMLTLAVIASAIIPSRDEPAQPPKPEH
jgi:hypothetical protein